MGTIKEINNTVEIFKNRKAMGEAAGQQAEAYIIKCLERKKQVRVVFAAAPSQNEMLNYLVSGKAIDWTRVIAFHMDEYIGLPEGAPQNFSYFLREKIFSKLPFGKVNYICGNADEARECERYSALLSKAPIDVLLCGIGENGHLAFNDPPVADFKDPALVKPVTLEKACRLQQVKDGCFPSLDKVPKRALTLTIPVLMSAAFAVCTVPGERKAEAVERALKGPVSEKCPASILRLHKECRFFLDAESGRGLL
jgi:glucosamine-6-phosphate deaminase